MEQLKTARANRKRALTKACNTTEHVTVEQEHDAIVAHRRHLMATFRLFEDAANAYAAELENKEEITTAEGYYDQEEKHEKHEYAELCHGKTFTKLSPK